MDSDATKDNSTYKAVKSKSPSDTGADAFQEALLGKIGAVAQEMGTSNQVLNTLSSHMGTMTLQLGTLINFSLGAQAAHGTAGAVNCTGLVAVIPMFLRCERMRVVGTNHACMSTQRG